MEFCVISYSGQICLSPVRLQFFLQKLEAYFFRCDKNRKWTPVNFMSWRKFKPLSKWHPYSLRNLLDSSHCPKPQERINRKRLINYSLRYFEPMDTCEFYVLTKIQTTVKMTPIFHAESAGFISLSKPARENKPQEVNKLLPPLFRANKKKLSLARIEF